MPTWNTNAYGVSSLFPANCHPILYGHHFPSSTDPQPSRTETILENHISIPYNYRHMANASDQFHWGPTNPHPLSKMRTELVWDGKYDEFGNRRLVDTAACAMPMQKIETVDEPRQRAAAEGQTDMFEQKMLRMRETAPAYKADFRNRLIWGDNKLVMASLLKDFKGQIDLIYIDPPFDVGADFTMDVPIGDTDDTIEKDQSTLEMVAYRDMWGKGTDSYVHMMFERLIIMKDLLTERGNVFVHCDWRVVHYLKLILDDVFGLDCFRNEIIWQHQQIGTPRTNPSRFAKSHETVLWYSKSPEGFILNYKDPAVRVPWSEETRKTMKQDCHDFLKMSP